jgi:hypothetical protein
MKTILRRSLCIALAVSLSLVAASEVNAQAYCALRDPADQIYSLYPVATSYRSMVGKVNATTRNQVAALMPFTLHSHELGQHTLYVTQRGMQSIGLVHVRSEPSDWGIIEIAWSIDLRMQLVDFRFQRCRGSACKSVDTARFRAFLSGKRLADLRGMFTADGTALTVDPGVSSEPGKRLAATVIRSALKTLAVTELVWGKELGVAG